MATTKKTTTTKAKATVDTAVETKVEEVVSKTIIPKEVDVTMEIPVRSAYQGDMSYINRHGEIYEWKEFGDVQYLELAELRIAKNTAKKFFVKNYFTFDEGYEWVPEYLGIGGLYKNCLSADRFDDLFDEPIEKMQKDIYSMTDAQKETVKYRAYALIENGTIDSRKVISALEECLGVELVEK